MSTEVPVPNIMGHKGLEGLGGRAEPGTGGMNGLRKWVEEQRIAKGARKEIGVGERV